MKTLLLCCCLLTTGCSPTVQELAVKPPATNASKAFTETSLGYNVALQVLVYEGKRHVFLVNRYFTDAVSVVKVGEYPIEGEKP